MTRCVSWRLRSGALKDLKLAVLAVMLERGAGRYRRRWLVRWIVPSEEVMERWAAVAVWAG